MVEGMQNSIKVNYKWTDKLEEAVKWLEGLPDVISCDFEVSSKYTREEKIEASRKASKETNWFRRIKYQQIAESSGLSHPSLCIPTHLSIAWSDKNSMVFVLPNEDIRAYVCNWLVDTNRKEVWHNAAYDFRILLQYANSIPRDFEDTLLMVKTLSNSCVTIKNENSLKSREGMFYGNWAISKENFTLEEMYNEEVIKYSAIDSCATYHLYQEILYELRNTNESN